MPPYAVSHAHYNVKFAKAVVDAFLHGRETFAFKRARYTTAERIGDVLEDIKNGYYSFKVSLV